MMYVPFAKNLHKENKSTSNQWTFLVNILWYVSTNICYPMHYLCIPMLESLMDLFFQCIISTPHVLQILMDLFIISTLLVL
jgi:hypothetical protein